MSPAPNDQTPCYPAARPPADAQVQGSLPADAAHAATPPASSQPEAPARRHVSSDSSRNISGSTYVLSCG